jgi:hypothetical protein
VPGYSRRSACLKQQGRPVGGASALPQRHHWVEKTLKKIMGHGLFHQEIAKNLS